LEGVTAAAPTETLIRNLAIAFSNLQPLLPAGGRNPLPDLPDRNQNSRCTGFTGQSQDRDLFPGPPNK